MVKPGTSSEQQPPSDSKYKGVRKRKWGKWVSEIRLPNSRERIWLGSFDSPEKAARAFDAALYCLRGPDAKFNFPENPPEIPGGRSLTPPEIQVVAARFANEEPPPLPPPSSRSYNENAGESSHSHMMDHYTSSSTSVSDGTVHVDGETAMDWSFLNLLDATGDGSDFGLYHGLDHSGLYPPPTMPEEDPGDDQNDGVEAYSQPSFLWNF